MDDRFQGMVARIGADDYLDMCARSLVRQDARLRQTHVSLGTDEDAWESGREIIPDIWLTLIALNDSMRALALAAKVSRTRSQVISGLRQDLTHRSSTKHARDVYEHLDDYFQGAGKLQLNEGERRDMHLPQVAITRDATQITKIEVRIGGSPWIDVFAAIEQTRQALSKALELLRSEDQ
jgi:hypothetical protein